MGLGSVDAAVFVVLKAPECDFLFVIVEFNDNNNPYESVTITNPIPYKPTCLLGWVGLVPKLSALSISPV
ncbi:hypothetical protein NECAME_00045 [Necator americanus]|uniref:Uncharacterized protein n=1 Tax=Necator americanus TaxID=51031 RepID=W2U1D9_NECAM|nr:hypothetical protein NECAME_00045 [Necator americanus]ETN87186.1 hypothetical protein NECAME_00045 [Necator americanus]